MYEKNGKAIKTIELEVTELQAILDDFQNELPAQYLQILDFIEFSIIDRARVIKYEVEGYRQ